MAYTFETDTIRVVHNGDWSGAIQLVDKASDREFYVTLEDLKAVMARYARKRQIEALEDADDDEVLGFTTIRRAG